MATKGSTRNVNAAADGDLAPPHLGRDEAARLLRASGDVTITFASDDRVQHVAARAGLRERLGVDAWIGRSPEEIFTPECAPRLRSLLSDVAAAAPGADGDDSHWRELNLLDRDGADVPISAFAVGLEQDGRRLLIGRDLGQVSTLQKRLVDAQQTLERDYARFRQLETRYRMLFRLTSEAVIVVDAASRRIVEANPAAGALLGRMERALIGRTFPDGFDEESARRIRVSMDKVRATGVADDVTAQRSSDGADAAAAQSGGRIMVATSLFRQDRSAFFLVRMSTDAGRATNRGDVETALLSAVAGAPEGLVVTSETGEILYANAAFLDLAQLATEEQTRGRPLRDWLGRAPLDWDVLRGNLKEHGAVRLYATVLRGEHGVIEDVEVSAVAVENEEAPCYGFMLHRVSTRLDAEPEPAAPLPRSVEQMTQLVGRVPLKDLVRETTDMIERLCIEAALELTGDNRASAAELLGLSRQSLYVKLRRYGLGDLDDDASS